MVAFIADDLARDARGGPGTVEAANREGE
jgi:hypothetical protein